MAPSLQMLARSAPVSPEVWRASWLRSTSSASGLPARVHEEDRLAPGEIGRRDEHLAVEAPRPQQSGIEVFEAVRGGDDDDLVVVAEAVELDEQLVERLVVLAVEAGAGAPCPDGVELVDEDDRRRVLARAVEELADAGGAEAGEHLDEGGGALRVEGRARGVRDGLREQRLAGPGRAVEKDALGDASAELGEVARVPEEVDDLLQLRRRLVHARDVVPGDGRLRGRLDLGRPHARHERQRLPDQEDDQPEEDQGQPRQGEIRQPVEEVSDTFHPPVPSAGRGEDLSALRNELEPVGFGRYFRPTFADSWPSVRTMSPVKSLSPRMSDEPTP